MYPHVEIQYLVGALFSFEFKMYSLTFFSCFYLNHHHTFFQIRFICYIRNTVSYRLCKNY
jgi:hypothetical protein